MIERTRDDILGEAMWRYSGHYYPRFPRWSELDEGLNKSVWRGSGIQWMARQPDRTTTLLHNLGLLDAYLSAPPLPGQEG